METVKLFSAHRTLVPHVHHLTHAERQQTAAQHTPEGSPRGVWIGLANCWASRVGGLFFQGGASQLGWGPVVGGDCCLGGQLHNGCPLESRAIV